MRKRNVKGLTLLEVLVMAIIISVLAVASSTALFNGLGFLKEAEDTSRASSLAYSMMEYSLSRGYENLADVGPLTYTWPDNLTTEYFIHVRTGKQPSNFKREIPFKEVNVTASYWRNQTFRYKTKRSIFLSNKVPYPTIHTLHYKYVAPTVTAHKIPQDASVREINEENAERMVNDRYKFMPFNDAGDKYLPVDINFEVPKDITFQICVSIRPGPNTKMADVDSASTMRMQPMFDDEIFGLTGLGGGWSPLKSQQVQCQVVTRKNVKAGPHKLSVKWIQDEVRSAGNEVDFYLRQVEVSVMATESLMGAEPPEGKPHGE